MHLTLDSPINFNCTLPEMSNSGSTPAEPGLYLKEIIAESELCVKKKQHDIWYMLAVCYRCDLRIIGGMTTKQYRVSFFSSLTMPGGNYQESSGHNSPHHPVFLSGV